MSLIYNKTNWKDDKTTPVNAKNLNNIEDGVEYIYYKWDKIIQDSTTGDHAAELIDARYGPNDTEQHPTLGHRLNHMDNKFKEVNSQLEHNVNQIKNINSVKISACELGLLPNTDITKKLQEILNDTNNKYQIEFEKNKEYILTDSITIDLNKNSIIGNGCVFSSKILDESKYTFIITSSLSKTPCFIRNGGSPTGNIVNTFNNCIIQTFKDDNYTYYRKSNGILLSNSKGKSAHLTFDNLSILGFKEGVSFSSETYMCTFNKININYCNTCIALKQGFSDMGERLHFANGCIGDSELMILNETDQALHFHNMSFDFSNKLFDNAGQLYFTNCHIEAPSRYFDFDDEERNYWGDIRGTGSVFIDSSRMLLVYGDSSNRKLKYLFKSHSESCGLYLANCHVHIFAEFFLNDIGLCKINNIHKFNTYSPSIYSQEKQNLYVDPDCVNINNIVSSDANAEVKINNGYECTHLLPGTNQQHIIKLPKLNSSFRILIKFNTELAKNYFFNSITIRSRDSSSGINWSLGTMNTVVGENVLKLSSDSLRKEGYFFNPNTEYELVLNSFGIPSGTKFTITKIIVNQLEN